jgi:hypothetical protein
MIKIHYKLPVLLYECEIWSLALTEEYILQAFEIRALRKILGPLRKGMTEG